MSILPDPKIIEQTLCELATHIKAMHEELHAVVSDLHKDSEKQTKLLEQILEELRHSNIN
jgi:hypothetical protein